MSKIDWEAIEREYSKGVRSNRDLAAEYGVSEAAIRKKAGLQSWVRDLKGKIKLAAEDKVRKEEFAKSARGRICELNIVQNEAEILKRIAISHRKDIQLHLALNDKHLVELQRCDEDIIRKIDSHKKLVDTLKTLICLEREAFGLSDNSNGNADQLVEKVTATYI